MRIIIGERRFDGSIEYRALLDIQTIGIYLTHNATGAKTGADLTC